MQFIPYLNFNGNCEQAFKFYEQTFAGKIESMFRHEGTPVAEHVPPNWLNKIMHASMTWDGGAIMGSDAPPDHYKQPAGFSVSIHTKEPSDAENKFEALSKGGKVVMPIQQTFWARRFGMLIDQFGIPWMINCE